MSNLEKLETTTLKEFEDYLFNNFKFESASIVPAGPIEEKEIADDFEQEITRLINDKFPGIFSMETKFWETHIAPFRRKISDEGLDYDTLSHRIYLHLGNEDEYLDDKALNIMIDYEYTGDGVYPRVAALSAFCSFDSSDNFLVSGA